MAWTVIKPLEPFLQIGDVFAQHSLYGSCKTSYWKVKDIKTSYDRGITIELVRSERDILLSYRVIKCNKNGLEFKDTNGFDVKILDKYLKMTEEQKASSQQFIPFILIKRHTSEQSVVEKAYTEEGIKAGRDKRRIGYLMNRIARDTKELNKLFAMYPTEKYTKG